MQEMKDFQEVCLDKLSVTDGAMLEMMANITSAGQFDLILMGGVYGDTGLRSQYFRGQEDRCLRLTVSHMGRGRTDVVEIGKSVKLPGWGFGSSGGDARWGGSCWRRGTPCTIPIRCGCSRTTSP